MSEHDRPSDIPMQDVDLAVEEAVGRLKGRIRNCTRNAYLHLRRAWKLHHVDNEMSALRAITAEEEATTALMLALKARAYPEAERLDPRSHLHKSAVTPFIRAVGGLIADTKMVPPNLQISRVGEPKATIQIDVAALAGLSRPLFGTPDHPLNFVVSRKGDARSAANIFEKRLDEIAKGRNFETMLAFVRAEANLRNRLLYASDEGIPSVESRMPCSWIDRVVSTR